MTPITNQILRDYLEDTLGEIDSARVEQELRVSDELRGRLREFMKHQDHGEHSLGAIWRRHRVTCPTREQIGSFLLDAIDPDLRDYIAFHLDTIGCPYCQANRDDLANKDRETAPAQALRRRIFDSSAGLLKDKKKK